MPDFTSEEIEEVVKAARKLEKANLGGANLTRANLREARLQGGEPSAW